VLILTHMNLFPGSYVQMNFISLLEAIVRCRCVDIYKLMNFIFVA